MTKEEMMLTLTDEELAEAYCKHVDCDDCPALSLCILYEGESNGLGKWLKKWENEREEG